MKFTPKSHPNIDPTVRIGENVTIARDATVHSGVEIGFGCKIGDGVVIEHNAIFGRHVKLEGNSHVEQKAIFGPSVTCGRGLLVMGGGKICPDAVTEHSRDARTLGANVSVGPQVLLHGEVELGDGAIVPSQRTITHLGHFGSKNRVVTIYGSDGGPRYSIGCKVGIDFDLLVREVASGVNAQSAASAATYEPYLPVFNQVGRVVQVAYDAATLLVEDIKAQRQDLGLLVSDY